MRAPHRLRDTAGDPRGGGSRKKIDRWKKRSSSPDESLETKIFEPCNNPDQYIGTSLSKSGTFTQRWAQPIEEQANTQGTSPRPKGEALTSAENQENNPDFFPSLQPTYVLSQPSPPAADRLQSC